MRMLIFAVLLMTTPVYAQTPGWQPVIIPDHRGYDPNGDPKAPQYVPEYVPETAVDVLNKIYQEQLSHDLMEQFDRDFNRH